MNKVKFLDYNCKLEKSKYSNGRVALSLVDEEDGQPVATATVNLPDIPLHNGMVHIKNYSENEGMAEALSKVGVIMPMRRIKVGYNGEVVEAILLTQNT